MKKIVFVLTALLLATPAMANVTISCAQDGSPYVSGSTTVVVSYLATEDGNLPRGFGLEISVDNGKTIDSISYTDPCYWVYPGSIVIVDGNMTGQGTPVASGLGTGNMIVEMGSLHYPAGTGSASAPGLADVLLKFNVSDTDCNVVIAGNGTRGNVVNYAAGEADVVYTGCSVAPPCFPSGHPDYAEWVAVGYPDCWCNPRQCHGDAAGDVEGSDKLGWWYVGNNDLNELIPYWKVTEGAGGTPADCLDY